MIEPAHDLAIAKQAKALNISRGSVYYLPRPVPEADLAIMRRLDRLHLEFPFAGSRMLRGLLAAEGCKIGRRHVKTLMKRMGIEALYRRPRTTKPEPGHKIYPYLLRGMEVVRPNQVWAMDITYIPMARGFVYLAVVLDWFSRRVLSWGVSITMEAAFCGRALTAPRPIKPTSPRCHSAWQPNPGRGSTYRRGKSVQTTGTTSLRIFLSKKKHRRGWNGERPTYCSLYLKFIVYEGLDNLKKICGVWR